MIKSMIWLALANLCRGDSSAMDDNKQFWERFSRHYAGFIRRSQTTYQQICKAMRPFLKRDMDVLELACGTGQLSVPLSPCVRSWEATDFSAEMIRQAKKQVYSSRLHFSVQDATKLPYGPESFDAVVISNALHVMPHPEKGSGGGLAGSEAGGIAVRPHLCLGQKPKRQTPALVHGAVRLSGVPRLDCRGADGIPVRAEIFHRSPSASRKFVGADVLSDGQEDPG